MAALLGTACLVLAASLLVLAAVHNRERRLRAAVGHDYPGLAVAWGKHHAGIGPRRPANQARGRPVQAAARTGLYGLGGGAVGALLLGASGFLPGVGCGLVAAAAAGLSGLRRRADQLDEGFRQFVRDVQLNAAGGELAGRSIAEAASRVRGPLREALDLVVAGWQAGAPLEEALSRMPVLRRCQEYWGFLQAVWLHGQTGASLAELVGAVIETGDEVRLRRGELAAKAADARWTARILALVPPGLFLFLYLADHGAWRGLLQDPATRGGAIAGACLWAAGLLVVARLQVPPTELRG